MRHSGKGLSQDIEEGVSQNEAVGNHALDPNIIMQKLAHGNEHQTNGFKQVDALAEKVIQTAGTQRQCHDLSILFWNVAGLAN